MYLGQIGPRYTLDAYGIQAARTRFLHGDSDSDDGDSDRDGDGGGVGWWYIPYQFQ